MNTAATVPNDQASDPKVTPIPPPISVPTSGGGKEVEPLVSPTPGVTEISSEVPLSPEVEQAGVKQFRETIELPPDVKKLGVTPAAQPIASPPPPPLPPVPLPISDQAILAGLHASVLGAIRWLATWCMKKLKKAHIVLKTVHGKVIRVKAEK